jgi:hypothetical protein
MSYNRNINFELSVSHGYFDTEYVNVNISGTRSAINIIDTPINISVNGNTNTALTTARTLFLDSTSANDSAAGTGAQEVTIYGLDENGAFAQEALATNGASASGNTTTTFTRVFEARVTAAGSGETNEGVIEIGANIDAIKVLELPAGYGYVNSGTYTVATDYTLHLSDITILDYRSSSASTLISIYKKPSGGAWEKIFTTGFDTRLGILNIPFNYGLSIESDSDLKVMCDGTNADNTALTFNLNGVLLKNLNV